MAVPRKRGRPFQRNVTGDAFVDFDGLLILDLVGIQFERFLEAITPKTKMIIVANPNNPTGATVPREQLLAIAKAAPQAVLFVDEAYFHFHGDTVMGDVGKIPNLIVGRTFSKAYGLANLRVGLLINFGETRLKNGIKRLVNG